MHFKHDVDAQRKIINNSLFLTKAQFTSSNTNANGHSCSVRLINSIHLTNAHTFFGKV